MNATSYWPLSIFFTILIMTSYSCTKKCDCTQSWTDDCNLIYYPGDLVKHNGVCYKAFGQGKACAVEPGTNEDDIWNVCN